VARWRVPDLPLILEQLQDQLDDLRAVAKAQQVELERLEARIDILEGRGGS
jgi:hypothetical protein